MRHKSGKIMFTKILTLALTCNFNVAKISELKSKVVGGGPTNISTYPHSAFILMIRHSGNFICGASILNQRVLLTAAHCIERPFGESYAYTGHTNRAMGTKYQIVAVKPHELYEEHTVGNDIGLILVNKPIKFSKFVKRISIARWWPGRYRAAMIAGWGLIDEERDIGTQVLHHAEVIVLTYKECRRYISSLPKGCLCTGSPDGKKYASGGDSGSALLVSNYIQIGVVSYKKPNIRSVVAFSNVSFYYDWIKRSAKRLYCKNTLY